jgi:hypothetical protein
MSKYVGILYTDIG